MSPRLPGWQTRNSAYASTRNTWPASMRSCRPSRTWRSAGAMGARVRMGKGMTMSRADDEEALLCGLMDCMKAFQQKQPDPDGLLHGYSLGMINLFLAISTDMHLLPEQVEKMLNTTFENIRRNTLQLLRQHDSGEGA